MSDTFASDCVPDGSGLHNVPNGKLVNGLVLGRPQGTVCAVISCTWLRPLCTNVITFFFFFFVILEPRPKIPSFPLWCKHFPACDFPFSIEWSLFCTAPIFHEANLAIPSNVLFPLKTEIHLVSTKVINDPSYVLSTQSSQHSLSTPWTRNLHQLSKMQTKSSATNFIMEPVNGAREDGENACPTPHFQSSVSVASAKWLVVQILSKQILQ